MTRTRTALDRVAAQRLDGGSPSPRAPEVVTWDIDLPDGPSGWPRPHRAQAARWRRPGRLVAIGSVTAVVALALSGAAGRVTAHLPAATRAIDRAVGSPVPGFAGRPTATRTVPPGVDPSDMRLRAEFGLSTDPAHVRAVEAAADSTSDQIGIPLSPAERADMAHRQQLQDLALKVLPQLEKQPGYAGAWFDPLDGGALHIASTGPDFSATVRAVIPAGFAVHYDRARWSVAELTAVQDRIVAELVKRTAISAYLNGVTTHQSTNTVEVMLRLDAPPDAEAVLRRSYPQPFIHLTRTAAWSVGSDKMPTGPLRSPSPASQQPQN